MRITSNMQNKQIMNSMLTNQSDLAAIQNKIASEQKINSASENPSAVTPILNAKETLCKIDTYQSNINYLNGEANITDTTLGQISDALQRIKTLTIQAANATTGPEALKDINSEIKQLKEQIVNLANTKYENMYLFSGNRTGTPAYTIANDGSIVYNGTPASENYKREYNIADGVEVSLNYPGETVLGYSTLIAGSDPPEYEGTGLFNTLNNLTAIMDSSNPDYSLIRNKIDELEKDANVIINTRTEVGGIQNRLNMTEEQHETNKITYTAIGEDLQGIDLTQAVSELSLKEAALQASLYVGSQVMNISLLDYL